MKNVILITALSLITFLSPSIFGAHLVEPTPIPNNNYYLTIPISAVFSMNQKRKSSINTQQNIIPTQNLLAKVTKVNKYLTKDEEKNGSLPSDR